MSNISGVIKKLGDKLWILRALIPSIYFNFHFLPFKQAIRLPILVYKPKFQKLSGTITINAPIKFGMIRLGCNMVGIYPNSGIQLQIEGKLIFNGKCRIGNNCAIALSSTGTLTIGNNSSATADVKIICYDSVSLGENTLIGWSSIISDSDFHEMESPGGTTTITAPIEIGNNNWFAMQCLVLKGAKTVNDSVFAARALVNKDYTDNPPRTLYAGSPAKPCKSGYCRKLDL